MPTTTEKKHETLIDAFLGQVYERPDRRFLTQPLGDGECKYWTFSETLDETKRMAAYLTSLNLPNGSSIALCSKNCAWWVMADLAIQMAGHVTIPIYPTLTADTVSYILDHSESKLLFVGKLDEHPWAEMKKGVPTTMPIVTFPLCPSPPDDNGKHEAWDDLVKKHEPMDPIVMRKPDEMATIIYTSGSTGTL